MQATSPARKITSRVQSVDLLRGLVMIVMALDHVRDFFHLSAYHFSPEDLSKTTGMLFFTRWITHFCAPVFVFLAGVSVQFSSTRRQGRGSVSRHLVTRGLWLVFLELIVLEFMWTFNFRYELVILQVIWTIGCCMIALAALIWLPPRLLAVLSLAAIAFHNLLDPIPATRFGPFAAFWNVLHGPTMLTVGHTNIFILYPLIPWVAVMAAGYCFAPVFRMDDARRRTILLRTGGTLIAAFFALRFLNVYGDPQPWSVQSTAAMTVASFFRATKYPPSLIYLLMTLGPAILLLGLADRLRVSEANPLRVFGRVPLFYYLCHFFLIHAAALLASGLRYGRWDYFLHFPGALLGLPDPNFPADWGYSLPQVYLIWAAVVASLYLPCRWYLRQVKLRAQ